MDPSLFGTIIQVESKPNLHEHVLPTTPKRVVSRTYPAVPQDDSIELDSLRSFRNGVNTSAPTTPRTERDLEMSYPGTPVEPLEPVDAVDALPTLNNPPMNKYRLASCCFQTFLGGLTDSAPGALIPYMET